MAEMEALEAMERILIHVVQEEVEELGYWARQVLLVVAEPQVELEEQEAEGGAVVALMVQTVHAARVREMGAQVLMVDPGVQEVMEPMPVGLYLMLITMLLTGDEVGVAAVAVVAAVVAAAVLLTKVHVRASFVLDAAALETLVAVAAVVAAAVVVAAVVQVDMEVEGPLGYSL